MTQALTKIEVAKQQLKTAIELFFNDKDPVSVYTLASNAWEVIDALCNQNELASLSNETRKHIHPNKSLKHDYINSPYRNFFKHADRDPDEKLANFCDQKNDALLFLAVEDYMHYKNRSPITHQVYQLWFLAMHPDKIIQQKYEEIIQKPIAYFQTYKMKAAQYKN